MIFLNILKTISAHDAKKLPNKTITNLIRLHQIDKSRIAFLRSKLKYGKVLFQLEYQYYKGKYLINTVYKPVLINQAPDVSNKYSVESIAEYVSIKKDIWGFLFISALTFFIVTYIYVESYNYIYVDLGNDPKFLCFKSTISRINSNYFEPLLISDPLQDLIGNSDLCPNSDFLVFLSGCSKSEFTRDTDFFLNEFRSILGFKN